MKSLFNPLAVAEAAMDNKPIVLFRSILVPRNGFLHRQFQVIMSNNGVIWLGFYNFTIQDRFDGQSTFTYKTFNCREAARACAMMLVRNHNGLLDNQEHADVVSSAASGSDFATAMRANSLNTSQP